MNKIVKIDSISKEQVQLFLKLEQDFKNGHRITAKIHGTRTGFSIIIEGREQYIDEFVSYLSLYFQA